MEPLASRLRPQDLEDVVGHVHLIGPGKPLRVAIDSKHLFSFILWGPPGSGKTTLARIYSQKVGADFFELSAVTAGKDDIRRIVAGRSLLSSAKPRVLFVDEIHRFSKVQQDFLLPFVERGDVTLVGATTENPSFEVIAPLLSRCRVFILEGLSESDLKQIIVRTNFKVSVNARDWLIRLVNGDARQAITILDTTHRLYGKISLDTLKETVQSSHIRYDKKGDEHYNTASAFIKSMRASQPDAALYYLARMVHAGEDPTFIARRMVIFASEDIGLAQPTALVVANAVFEAVVKVGYPEASINLAHGVAYLAQCKKDRRVNDAIARALIDARELGNLPIPLHVRNAATPLMEKLGYGKGYKKYDMESYLPEQIKKKKYLDQ